MLVELMSATLPAPLGAVAAHYWFNVLEPASGLCDRWEIWQRKGAGGASVGHLHCNLMGPRDGVGGGLAELHTTWEGEPASRIRGILETAGKRYPHCHQYRPFPGPNSNTFVAWVLREAGIDQALEWKALGKGYAWRDA